MGTARKQHYQQGEQNTQLHLPKPPDQLPQTQDHRIYDPSTTTPRVRTICMGPVCAEGHQESGDGTKARSEVCHQPVPQHI